MAAFGWSVSDLVQTITIIYKICTALKDTGGASEEYQETVAFLRSLALTLDTLRALDVGLADSDDLAFTQAQIDLVQGPVRKFTAKIEAKFDFKLGIQAAKGVRGAISSAPRKARWALLVSNESKSLKDKISVPLCAIQVKASLKMLSLASNLQSTLPLDVSSKVIEAVTNMIPALIEKSISSFQSYSIQEEQAQISRDKILIEKLEDLLTLITRDISHTVPILLDSSIEPLRLISERQIQNNIPPNSVLARKIDNIPQQVHQHFRRDFQSIRLIQSEVQVSCMNIQEALDKSIRRLRVVGSILAETTDTQREAPHGSAIERQAVPQNTWIEAGMHLRLFLHFFATAFYTELSHILRIITRCLLYIRTFKSYIIQSPSLLLESNFTFIDVLGRIRSLPCLYYNNWDTFERFLHKDFENIPGERHILENRYHITNRQGQIIQPTRWHNFAVAKAKLSMAVVLALSVDAGHCPKCKKLSQSATPRERTICPNCHLVYSTIAKAQMVPKEPQIVELPDDNSTTNQERDADNEITKEEQEAQVEKDTIRHGKYHEKLSLQEQQAHSNEDYELKTWFRSVYLYPSASLENLSTRVTTIVFSISRSSMSLTCTCGHVIMAKRLSVLP